VSLASLHRQAATVRVRVASGSDSFDAWVTYHANLMPLAANKPLFVILACLMYDITCINALAYCVGPEAAVRGPGRNAWRHGVLPNRVGVKPSLAVLLLPGDPGVGKTTAVRCVSSLVPWLRSF